MSKVAIQSVRLVDNHITILFDQDWFQEDIVELHRLLLARIPNSKIKEFTLGADRENIRFQWQSAEFMLNFDYYSQSCWVSSQDEISLPKIPQLFNTLVQP
jgi:hypothetical protein